MSGITMNKRFEWFIRDINVTLEELQKKTNDLVSDNDCLNKRCEELQIENEQKDEKIVEQEEEIEKLKKIISNMEDGEGLVDFVDDFVKRDEENIKEKMLELEDKTLSLTYARRHSQRIAIDFSRSFNIHMEEKLSNLSLPKCLETTFEMPFDPESIADVINAWYYKKVDDTGDTSFTVGVAYCCRQDDQGNNQPVNEEEIHQSGMVTESLDPMKVNIHMSRPVTGEDVKGELTMYLKAFKHIGYFNPNLESGFGGYFDWRMGDHPKNSVCIEDKFIDDVVKTKIVHLHNIWYVTESKYNQIYFVKSYRNDYVSIDFKTRFDKNKQCIQFIPDGFN